MLAIEQLGVLTRTHAYYENHEEKRDGGLHCRVVRAGVVCYALCEDAEVLWLDGWWRKRSEVTWTLKKRKS